MMCQVSYNMRDITWAPGCALPCIISSQQFCLPCCRLSKLAKELGVVLPVSKHEQLAESQGYLERSQDRCSALMSAAPIV